MYGAGPCIGWTFLRTSCPHPLGCPCFYSSGGCLLCGGIVPDFGSVKDRRGVRVSTTGTARQPMRLRAFDAIASRWWSVLLVTAMAVAVVFNKFDPVALGFEKMSGW